MLKCVDFFFWDCVCFGSVEPYPSEALRAELCVKLGLTDRQMKMWFCHRRVKDKKTMLAAAAAEKLQSKLHPVSAPMGEGVEQIKVADVMHDRGLATGLRPIGHLESQRVVYGMMALPMMRAVLPATESSSYYESHQTIKELRAIAFVERQLGEPLRENGPILGMEFDSLPPAAFGSPIGKLGFLTAFAFHVPKFCRALCKGLM